jgi:ParB family chromosome partitioning protein
VSEATRRVRPGLGRGLGALLGEVAPIERTADAPPPGVHTVPVGALTPHPHQPRRRFDETALDELAASIGAQGIIQPIVVRAHGHGYQIVAGERRWRAAQRAGLDEVPVVIREFSDSETLQIALVENIQRQDLNAIEEAQAYRRLLGEFGHTQEALAKVVHKSRSHVANLLRLLDLPEPVQARVVEGTLSMGHARALIGSPDPDALAEQVVHRGLSVRQTERMAQARKPAGRTRTAAAPVVADPDIAALEEQLADLLGLKVRIALDANGAGTLTLNYASADQLDMLCQRLTGGGI